ncbi:hypothetical protein [Streptomyces sp. NPDC053720]|uniref:hypothetical protein n=1 Tax=Streptomyces sp. NPDC053720 TaxID=3154855 RepID=UPI00341B3617
MKHDPDHPAPSSANEFVARADELKADDRLSILGGAAVLTVLEATHGLGVGPTLLRVCLPAGGTGFVRLPPAAPVSIHRPQAEPDRSADDDKLVETTVALSVTETVTYEFEVETEVPAYAIGDADALHEYLTDNEELWVEHVDPLGANGYLCVVERSLDDSSVVLAA